MIIGFGPVLLLVLVVGVGVAIASARSGHHTAVPGGTSPAAAAPVTTAPSARARPPRRSMATVTEALGYLGGVLAIVGLGMFVGAQWADLSNPVRLAISGVAAAVLVTVGALVHADADPAYERLRAFVWLLSTAATGLFAGVAADAAGVEAGEWIAATVAGAVAVESAVLWQWKERPLQQLTTLGGVTVAVGTSLTMLLNTTLAGLTVWVLGAALVVAGLTRRTPTPMVTELVGAIAVLAGPLMVIDWSRSVGLLLLAATSFTMLAMTQVRGLVPTLTERVGLGVIGGFAAVQSIGPMLAEFGRDAGLLTGMAVWVAGVGLLLVAHHPMVTHPIVPMVGGGLALLGGAALTALQTPTFATLFGIGTSVALIALGTRPDLAPYSILGSAGLLVFVPWSIAWFFPGEGRAPLLIMVSGGLILGVAFLLARRFARQDRAGPDGTERTELTERNERVDSTEHPDSTAGVG